ncbi:hypothetical protein B5F44_11795 [Gordonibacter urolithinfaciens]|nr:hypothetical protein B5F44_11795 [Gordonibacter urolithinfaciens]ROT93191.1 hypothetical protein DMP13_02860 [Gordonibacter urolithinfaciens]
MEPALTKSMGRLWWQLRTWMKPVPYSLSADVMKRPSRAITAVSSVSPVTERRAGASLFMRRASS